MSELYYRVLFTLIEKVLKSGDKDPDKWADHVIRLARENGKLESFGEFCALISNRLTYGP